MRGALLWAALAGLAAAEEEAASPVAFAIATTLMGTVFVLMLLYYLFNWQDPDIRKYSYEVVSSTISVFAAVLLFQSIQNSLQAWVIEGNSTAWKITINFLHRLFWQMLLQISLAVLSKCLGYTDEQRATILEEAKTNPSIMANIEVNMKCYGVLLAHMTGFASINAWGSVQQTEFFGSYPILSFLVVPACIVFNIPLLWATNTLRESVSKAGDGQMDDLEKKWDEEVEEAENDVSALGLSFLTLQSIKYFICGTLANGEGEEPDKVLFGHTCTQCLLLFLFGVICIPIFCYSLLLISKKQAEHTAHVEEYHKTENQKKRGFRAAVRKSKQEKQVFSENQAKALTAKAEGPTHEITEKELEDEAEDFGAFERKLEVIICSFSMGMAWSFFYATRWSMSMMPVWGGNEMLLAEAIAMVISVVCFVFIFALDMMADAEWSSGQVDQCIGQVVVAFGILVGFSWEQTFDESVTALASTTAHPVLIKLILGVMCAFLVVPAWKMYMLPMIVHEGWRYGFIAHHVTEHLEVGDKEAMDCFFEQLTHLISGHITHETSASMRMHISKLLREELEMLEHGQD